MPSFEFGYQDICPICSTYLTSKLHFSDLDKESVLVYYCKASGEGFASHYGFKVWQEKNDDQQDYCEVVSLGEYDILNKHMRKATDSLYQITKTTGIKPISSHFDIANQGNLLVYRDNKPINFYSVADLQNFLMLQ